MPPRSPVPRWPARLYLWSLAAADWLHAHRLSVTLAGAPLLTLALAALNQFVLLGFPNSADEYVYLYQARMFAAGLVAETRALLPGLAQGRTASRALGYQQVLAGGPVDEAAAATVVATRRFVRRQRSWFRRDPRVHWLDAAAPDLGVHLLAEPEVDADRLAQRAGVPGMLSAGLTCLEALATTFADAADLPREELLQVVLPAALAEHELLREPA